MKNKIILRGLYALGMLVFAVCPVYSVAAKSIDEDSYGGVRDILKTYESLVDSPKNKIVLKKIPVPGSGCDLLKTHKVVAGDIAVGLPEGIYSKYYPDAFGLESVIWSRKNPGFRVFVYADLKLQLAPVKDVYMVDGQHVDMKDLFRELGEIKLNPVAAEKDVDVGFLVKSIMLFLIKKPYLVKTVKYYDLVDGGGSEIYVYYGDKIQEGVSIFANENDNYVAMKVFGMDYDGLMCMIGSIGKI